MPFGFPSHVGLILPLQRRFPRHLDAVALSVGALMPDVVDGAAWLYRGELGQWAGHSLLGVGALCVPAGLGLAWLARRWLPRAWIDRLDGGATPARPVASVLIGALSHVVFDLVTHRNFLVLWPWYENAHLFPDWWTTRWGEIDVFLYRTPYALAPHSLAWLILSVAGAVLFVRCLRRPGPASGGPPEEIVESSR